MLSHYLKLIPLNHKLLLALISTSQALLAHELYSTHSALQKYIKQFKELLFRWMIKIDFNVIN